MAVMSKSRASGGGSRSSAGGRSSSGKSTTATGAGKAGKTGKTGKTGKRGAQGKTATATCRVTGKRAQRVACTVRIRPGSRAAKARLTRLGRTYARGHMRAKGTRLSTRATRKLALGCSIEVGAELREGFQFAVLRQ